jgi:hypothetical protein
MMQVFLRRGHPTMWISTGIRKKDGLNRRWVATWLRVHAVRAAAHCDAVQGVEISVLSLCTFPNLQGQYVLFRLHDY